MFDVTFLIHSPLRSSFSTDKHNMHIEVVWLVTMSLRSYVQKKTAREEAIKARCCQTT